MQGPVLGTALLSILISGGGDGDCSTDLLIAQNLRKGLGCGRVVMPPREACKKMLIGSSGDSGRSDANQWTRGGGVHCIIYRLCLD